MIFTSTSTFYDLTHLYKLKAKQLPYECKLETGVSVGLGARSDSSPRRSKRTPRPEAHPQEAPDRLRRSHERRRGRGRWRRRQKDGICEGNLRQRRGGEREGIPGNGWTTPSRWARGGGVKDVKVPKPKNPHGPFMSTVDDDVEGVKAIPEDTTQAV